MNAGILVQKHFDNNVPVLSTKQNTVCLNQASLNSGPCKFFPSAAAITVFLQSTVIDGGQGLD